MRRDSHKELSRHISTNMLRSDIRQAWRQDYYWDAVHTHHRYCNDRSALIDMATRLHTLLDEGMGLFSQTDPAVILDMGCGRGEVSARLLQNIPGSTRPRYHGADKDAEVLAAAANYLAAVLPEMEAAFLQSDYASNDWSQPLLAEIGPANMVWLVHSAYYLESGHADFLQGLERLMAKRGMAMFMHNPEGNRPYADAASELGMAIRNIPYARIIRPPRLSPEEFACIKAFAGGQSDFIRAYPDNKPMQDFRLLLEFYLFEYPLDAISPDERASYVSNWEQHLQDNDGTFSNCHEMLLVFPRHVEPELVSLMEKLESQHV